MNFALTAPGSSTLQSVLMIAFLWTAIGGIGFWLLDRLVRRFAAEQHYPGGAVIAGGAILSGLAAVFATPVCGLIPLVLFAGMTLSEIVFSSRG